jgi:hypothetical protein
MYLNVFIQARSLGIGLVMMGHLCQMGILDNYQDVNNIGDLMKGV